MNEQHALRVNGTEAAPVAPFTNTQTQREYRSGVFSKPRRDGSGGWGLVLIDLGGPARPVALADGATIGSVTRDVHVEGPGIAPEHARVSVRSDGCYIEDLASPEGTFVGGVRAKRIGVMHGDVVRLGQQLAIFVERDLNAYAGSIERLGGLVFGPKQRRDWIGPVIEMVKGGSSVCIEGPTGLGKRALARFAGSLRQDAGEVVVVDGSTDAKPAIPTGVRPATWVVLNADRLLRPVQLEIAHAVGRGGSAIIIATTNQPLDRATGDGNVAPWFATLFSGRRITAPSLDQRREDILPLLQEIATRRGIALDRFTPEFCEALVRAGWPGGVPELESVIVTAEEAAAGGLFAVGSVSAILARPMQAKPSLPPSADPALARARLEDALARANGSVASAARALGMSRQAIYREADRLGLDIARRKAPR